MMVNIVYPGQRGSNLEAALAFHEISGSLGIENQLILSSDLARKGKAREIYPEAKFFNFLSISGVSDLKRELSGSPAFFTMVSPKLMPLYLSATGKKILYFHATYDYSFSRPSFKDAALEKMSEFLMKRSDLVLATQYPLAWQIRMRLGIKAEVLPHPSYSAIRKGFFEESQRVGLPFKDYFLSFGGLDRASKGNDVLLEAVKGTEIPIVLAGKANADHSGSKNIAHLNRWVSDAELFWLVENSRAVVLPYLTSSQFSGCLALAYRFGKPVVAPFCNSFQKYVEDGKTGVLFEQGNHHDLREKLREFDSWIHCSESSLVKLEKRMDASCASKFQEILGA